MSLYRHIRDKDDLLDEVTDRGTVALRLLCVRLTTAEDSCDAWLA